ncbi:MAG: cupin domain-containing protein [Spirochaetota bacterium]
MFVSHINSIKSVPVVMDGVKDASKQVLIGPVEGWVDHVMRLFTLKEGGYTPRHSHPWPHINYITKGKGQLFLSGEEHPLTPGSVAYIPAGQEHQFSNNSPDDLAFICIVPKEGEK